MGKQLVTKSELSKRIDNLSGKEYYKKYMEIFFNYTPTDYQLDFIESCFTKKEVVAAFCRQTGKSETTSKIAVMMARILAGKKVLVFAPTDPQVGLMSEKIYKTIKEMVPIKGFQLATVPTKRKFEFENGSQIYCSTVGQVGNNIRGLTGGCIIMDEAAFIKDHIVKEVVAPMGATTDPTIIKISTPFGQNHFYETYKKGVAGNPRVAIHLVTWKDGVAAGILKKDYVEERRKEMTEKAFQREYEAKFVEDDSLYFSHKNIEACIQDYQIKDYEPDPKERGVSYYCGVDVSGGEGGTDLSVIMIVKKRWEEEKCKVVKMYAFKAYHDYIYDQLIALDTLYDFDRIYIDKTSIGAGLTDMLVRQFNPTRKVMRADVFDTGFEASAKVVGITFTNINKLNIFSYLKAMIDQKLLIIPRHPQLLMELGDFRTERLESGQTKLGHSPGRTDDYCDALALAVRGISVDNR